MGFMAKMRSLPQRRGATVAVVLLICMASLGVRLINLDGPCEKSCAKASDHSLVFDEVYYVNAARLIDGIAVSDSKHYGGAPTGEDPNAEHPQLGKLMIAGTIRIFGDNPLGWRLPSLILGTLAVAGMYLLVSTVNASRRVAAGSAALLAADNLFLVHGRIATLDILVLAFMIWACLAYLRGLHLTSGVLIGIGSCIKLMAPYLLLVFAVLEVLRRVSIWQKQGAEDAPRWYAQLSHLAQSAVCAAAVYLVVLGILDHFIPAYDPISGDVYRNPFVHTYHMVHYAVTLTGQPEGIASYGWQWLFDIRPISYLGLDTKIHVFGQSLQIATTHFLGFLNPLLVLLLFPGVIYAVVRFVRTGSGTAATGLAWFIGIYTPLLLSSVVWHRISYLYYMLLVLPGICIMVATLLSSKRVPRWGRRVWIAAFLLVGIALYPYVPVLDPNWA
jgi:predicted membrane-bound dolichyl-phosphate-mannose-protein mannosyltransferase